MDCSISKDESRWHCDEHNVWFRGPGGIGAGLCPMGRLQKHLTLADSAVHSAARTRLSLQHQLTEERERRERLEKAFAEFVTAVADYHNEHGCPGFIGARLSDARAALQQEDGDRE